MHGYSRARVGRSLPVVHATDFPWEFFSQNAKLTLTHAYLIPHHMSHVTRVVLAFFYSRKPQEQEHTQGWRRRAGSGHVVLLSVVAAAETHVCRMTEERRGVSRREGYSLVRDERTIDELQRCRGPQPLKLLNRA